MSRSTKAFLVLALLAIALLAMACAKGEKAAAPAPAAPSAAPAAAPTAAPAPVAAPAPAPAAAPAPAPAPAQRETAAATPSGTPLLPGAPPFFRKELETYKGYQLLQEYHPSKLPLWTKAKYGGHHNLILLTAPHLVFRFYDSLRLNRPTVGGMMLLVDSGRCSLVGREGRFDVCDGKPAANNNNVIVPGIFKSWEQPDPLTYIFRMRSGVLWPPTPPMARADREVTSADIVWFLDVTKKGGITAANFTRVDRFEALDRYTVKMTMKAPVADMLLNMAHTSQGIFPRECFEEKDCLGTVKSVSPAPFLVKHYELNQRLDYERNPEFWLKGLPYLDGISHYALLDPNAIYAAYITGQIDDAFPTTVEEAFNYLKKVPGAQMQTMGGHSAVPGAMRPALKGPLADVRVRRALTMTMDIPNMWQLSNGGFHLMSPIVGREYFGEEFWYTIEQLGQWYQFNPEKAKKLMEEAGYANGFSTGIFAYSFSWYGDGIALSLQSTWKKYLNVEVKIEKLERGAWNTRLFEKTWSGYAGIFCCWIQSCWGTPDDVFAQFIPGSPQNLQDVNDPVITDFYERQRGELDPVKRRQLLYEFDKHELDNLYVLRTGFCSSFAIMPPWELNGASHGTMYFGGLNGPTWLSMHDTSKSPDGR